MEYRLELAIVKPMQGTAIIGAFICVATGHLFKLSYRWRGGAVASADRNTSDLITKMHVRSSLGLS